MSLIVGLVLSGFGGLLVVAGVRRLFTAVAVHRSEAVPVRRVPQSGGVVEFDGRAEPLAGEDAFQAPFSGEEALCCAVWMETKDRHRTDTEGLEVGNSKEPANYRNTESAWMLVDSDDARRPFAVAEGGARVAVDPEGADLDVADHAGESVLTVDAGDPLPAEVRERLDALDQAGIDFDCSVETWTREGDRVQYRETRLEPGDPVHVTGGTVVSVPDEWGSSVDATVGAPDADAGFSVRRGTESSVVRDHLVQFGTGVAVGGVLLALGLHTLGVPGAL